MKNFIEKILENEELKNEAKRLGKGFDKLRINESVKEEKKVEIKKTNKLCLDDIYSMNEKINMVIQGKEIPKQEVLEETPVVAETPVIEESASSDKKWWDDMASKVKSFAKDKKIKLDDKKVARAVGHIKSKCDGKCPEDKTLEKYLNKINESVISESDASDKKWWDDMEAKVKAFAKDKKIKLDDKKVARAVGHIKNKTDGKMPEDKTFEKYLNKINECAVPTDETNKFLVKVYGLDGKVSRKYEVTTDKREEDLKFELSAQVKKGEKVIVKPFAKPLPGRDNVNESKEGIELIKAVKAGDLARVKMLLGDSPSNESFEDEHGIPEDKPAALPILHSERIKKNLNKVNPEDPPLIKAAKEGDLETIKRLLGDAPAIKAHAEDFDSEEDETKYDTKGYHEYITANHKAGY